MHQPVEPAIEEGTSSWAAVAVALAKTPVKTVHVIPLGDLKPHDVSESCWCHPERGELDEDLDDVVVHKALDNREAYEEGLLHRH